MTRIFVDKTEAIGGVIEKIIAAADAELTMVIPRDAVVKESISNFHLIKKQADELKKRIVIESVDDEVLALAKTSKLPAVHSFFARHPGKRSLSDIVPSGSMQAANVERKDEEAEGAKKAARKGKTKKEEKGGEAEVVKPPSPVPVPVPELPQHAEILSAPILQETTRAPAMRELAPRRMRRRFFAGGALALIVFFGGFWVVLAYFSTAEVIVDLVEYPWEHKAVVTATKAVSAVREAPNIIPAQFFSDKKTYVQVYPASDRSRVEEKATGKIVIYNAYGKSPQTLVASTRFLTPDGKLFRLEKQVTVPGAKVEGGKITPSSVEATVIADKAGPDYTVDKVGKLSIPGFQGTPKYAGFYGSLPNGTSGGFVGEKAVPSEKDVTEAKAKAQETLTRVLEANLTGSIPAGFVVPEGAKEFTFSKLTANRNTDDKGNFSVFAEGEFKAIAFRDADVKAVLELAAQKDRSDTVLKEIELSYTGVRPNFTKGEIVFTLAAKGTLNNAFDAEGFKKEAGGKKIREMQALGIAIRGLDAMQVVVWPRWGVWRIPNDEKRVTITVR